MPLNKKSKRLLHKWQENITLIEIQILNQKINFLIFQKHIKHYQMIKKEKFMINMEWVQMSRNNMKIWVFKEIVDLVVLEILVIFGEINNNNKEDLKIYSMILRISSHLEVKRDNHIDQREAQI